MLLSGSPHRFFTTCCAVAISLLVASASFALGQTVASPFSSPSNNISSSGRKAAGPRIWLADRQAFPVKVADTETLPQEVATGQAQPLRHRTHFTPRCVSCFSDFSLNTVGQHERKPSLTQSSLL